MLRKDVKLGFAIGGVMLAVLVVYVLVVPGNNPKTAQLLTEETPQAKAQDKQTPDAPAPTDVKPADPAPGTPAVKDTITPPTDDSAKKDASSTPGPVAHKDGTDWETYLNTGKAPPAMMTITPDPKAKNTAPDAPVAPQVAKADAPAPDTATDKTPDAPAADKAPATPDAATPAATGRTHVVQRGEMLTSIAAAVYGDSKQWKRIAAANPNVNPNRLKLGTTLVIPDAEAAAPAAAGTESAQPGAAVDPQTQYQVQSNDSLYSISVKLYGKADHVDKIYEGNKDTIGPDRARLKLHMILKLPEPPTATLATSASH